ncbi:pseudouridine synthase [Endozoicomonas sp. 2B-B]
MTFIAPHCQEPLTELYRDSELVVVVKPAGLLSVPGRPPNDNDSAHARLLAIEPETRVVHRLDMSTSGLMVFGLNAASHRELSRQFQDREVEKGYIAEVWGTPEQDSGEISLPLICDWPNRPRQKVDHEQGKKALTRYYSVAGDGTHGRVWLEPVTGRSHQLRVHLAELGHPILGCEFYAHDEARAASDRLRLHASLLTFKHPATAETMRFESQPPF